MHHAHPPVALRRGLAPALLLTALLAAPAAADTPLGCPQEFELRVLELVNQERAAAGLGPLVFDVRLMESAQLHSEDLALNNLSGHVGSNGSTYVERIEATGYTAWSAVAENVAGGFPTPESVVDAWMNSPGHRANILNGSVAHLGVGYVHLPGTQYWHYWTQNFGALHTGSRLATEMECPVCSNGIDDDEDGMIDVAGDPSCRSAWDESELSGDQLACGLGFEAALALVPIFALRARRQRRMG